MPKKAARIPYFPASPLYRGLEERHDFSAKFALSEEDFLEGAMKNFR